MLGLYLVMSGSLSFTINLEEQLCIEKVSPKRWRILAFADEEHVMVRLPHPGVRLFFGNKRSVAEVYGGGGPSAPIGFYEVF